MKAGSSDESGIGWNSHTAVDAIPDSLIKSIEGNQSMRRKFEELCRTAQVKIQYFLKVFYIINNTQISNIRQIYVKL
jgi:glyoxylate carboligase